MPDSSIQACLEALSQPSLRRSTPLAGGSINRVSRLHLADGSRMVIKQGDGAPPDMFAAEAAGLAALAANTSLRVPRVIAVSPDCLLLEDLGAGRPDPEFWSRLGLGLAGLHRSAQDSFGFTQDNYCGDTPQRNSPTRDGFAFFAEQRLMHLARRCGARGLLDETDLGGVEYVSTHLADWIPSQRPVLIHGDLWSGNIHCCEHGEPALIDPAAHWGWAEADLAMTTLFGEFDENFYASYEEASRIDSGWRDRAAIYNLYHLLNHVLLFGRSYLGQVRQTLARFTPRQRRS